MPITNLKMYFFIVLAFIIGAFVGAKYFYDDPNSKLVYGDTGYPKNCRAIITENMRGYKDRTFSAEQALDSIDRNCGEFGYSWYTR